MSQLQSSVDPTGALDQTGLNSQDIQNIIDEINRVNDQLTSNPQFREANGTQTINDGTSDRILIGLLPDATYGIVISKPGIDVNSVFS